MHSSCVPLLLLVACVSWAPRLLRADASGPSGVELRFAGYPGLACGDGRYPSGQRYWRTLPVAVSVVGADNSIRRTFGCYFEGDVRQLHTMATENGLYFVSLLPGTVSLAMPDADCVQPRSGLPADVFDVQMRRLGTAHATAGCLLRPTSRAAPSTRGADNDSTLTPDGSLLLRFQRVSFPTLECRYRGLEQPDVALRGIAEPLDDQFACRFRYKTKGEAVGALLRYLAGAYSLQLDAPSADGGLPLLTLRSFSCSAVGDDDSDADFVLTGPSGRSVGCKLSIPGTSSTVGPSD